MASLNQSLSLFSLPSVREEERSDLFCEIQKLFHSFLIYKKKFPIFPESVAESGMRAFRALLICTLFFLLFPLADVFTSWMLTIKGDHHQIRALIQEIDNQILTNTNFANVLTLDSLQSYPEEKISWKDDIDSDVLPPNSMQRQTWKDEIPEKDARWVQMMRLGGRKKNLNLLQDILEKKPEPSYSVVKESEIMDILNVSSNDWKRQTDAPMTSRSQKVDLPWAKRRTPRSNNFKMPIYQPSLPSNLTWFSRIPSRSYRKPAATCSALAPVPPAPFTPRRVPKRHLPRHQPCFVHVNQSKWTCQKNWPSVVYQEPKFTVMPRVYKKKGMGRTGEKRKGEEIKLSDVCAKKASQSMRKIPRPTDQCAGWLRHERQSIGYKAPLPCKVPTYKPTIPKKSYKPSTTPSDDWHHKRSQYRAQLRSRA
ncbi:hypothetical protein CAEBREN_11181 [Caenorhabditis brenneri]|uniref:Uncharacterized protein n=1 Tax=Caenorhabditis brenneri TaxID=135651 RepID=G0MZS7_CAEBE|nr:hypothetical protein CAEBREN_11181 [Caenorhabditis brenneri]